MLQGSADSNSSSHHAEGLYQPAAIFAGPQTSRPLPIEAEPTRATSGQPSSTAHDRVFCAPKHAASGAFKNLRLSKKSADGPPRRPEEASTVGELPAGCGDAGTAAGTRIALERLLPSPKSKASEEEAPSAVAVCHQGARTPPAKRIPGGLSKDGVATGDNESISLVSSPEFVPGEKRQDALGLCFDFKKPNKTSLLDWGR